MYEEFYGLIRSPFENTPNPEFFFASKQHREGLAALIYGIKQSKGFMLVTGEVGSGKTFLIQSLKYELEEENHIILEVATPWITPEELFAELPEKLGMDMDAEWGSLVFQARLKEELERLHAQGRRVLVILDEAQQLPERTLEGIRLLSNFENEDAKLIQIIFLGQNELNDILGRYSMRQIRQRITLSRSLGYFNEVETRRYIQHRLAISGCDKTLFNDDALSLIFRTSHGSPRLINLICDNCLITGYAHFAREIDVHIVREVLVDLPSVHYEAASASEEITVAEKPLRLMPERVMERATADEVKPCVAPSFPGAERRSKDEITQPEPAIRLATAPAAGSSPFMIDYESADEEKDKPGNRERPRAFGRYGFWLILIITVVASWYAARWYETRERDEIAAPEKRAPSVSKQVVASTPSQATAPVTKLPETKQRELTWDDDPVIANSTGNGVVSPTAVVQSIEVSKPQVPEATPAETVSSEALTEATGKASQSALERYSVGTKGRDGFSLFERLRREANVADIRDEPYVKPELAAQNIEAAEAFTEQKRDIEEAIVASVTTKTVTHQPVIADVSYKRVDTVETGGDGRPLIGVPEGVIVSSQRVKRYESGNAIPYPFQQLARQLKQPVPFSVGKTISEMARAKYSTWNDTVQDMVRTVNPTIRNLNLVYATSVNLPDVRREHLLVNDVSRGWFAYTGTVTSRLKANHLYESFVALGEPADMEVTNNGERRIYRVYMGPYDSREAVLRKLDSIDFTHMPYLK